MIKRTELLPAVIGIFIAILIVTFSYMWSAPAPVEFYQRGASHLAVVGGDRITVSWTEVRSGDCDSVVHRRLIAADRTITEFETSRNPPKPPGEELTSSFSFIVPPGLANGPLTYRVQSEFRCNFVQRWLGGQTLILPDIVFSYTREKK